jgi:hypothetical protein
VMGARELGLVLRVCDMWVVDDLRAATLAQIEPLFADPVNAAWQYRIARDCGLAHWLVPALETLILRADTLSAADVGALGGAAVAKVVGWRERNRDVQPGKRRRGYAPRYMAGDV